MTRSYLLAAAFYITILLSACNNNKPKPTSADITKQTVKVNGKKDSVLNNTTKNYGNATVSEPCVKCLIQAAQATDNYKKDILGTDPKNIKYKINWVKADGTVDTVNTKGATNALKLDVVNEGKVLSSFIYDNSMAKLYFAKNTSATERNEVKIEPAQLKKIRNACYWGVASGK